MLLYSLILLGSPLLIQSILPYFYYLLPSTDISLTVIVAVKKLHTLSPLLLSAISSVIHLHSS